MLLSDKRKYHNLYWLNTGDIYRDSDIVKKKKKRKYTSEMEKKSKRIANFTEAEKSILVDLVTAKKDILENKRTNTVSIKEKENCWEQLCNEYNGMAMNISRPTISLKNCWENIKKRTKKQFAEDRMQRYKTGGGQYAGDIDPLTVRVMDIIRPAVEGLSNALDSDCVGIDNEQYEEEWLEEENIPTNEQGEVLQVWICHVQ